MPSLDSTVTVADLIAETRRHLVGTHKEEWNVLSGAITASQTTLVIADAAGGIVRGAHIGIDSELMLVRSVSGTTVTVIRGRLGTEGAAHSDGALIEVQPRFSQFAISVALREEIRSWPIGLYRVDSVEVEITDTGRTFALTGFDSDYYSLLDIQIEPEDTDHGYRSLNGKIVEVAGAFKLQVNKPTGIDGTAQVFYSAPFTTTTWTDATNLVTDVGLTVAMLDIPPMGAAYRLLSMQEVKRTDTHAQGEYRRAEDVQGGHILQTANAIKRLRDMRIADEMARLRARNPIRGAF